MVKYDASDKALDDDDVDVDVDGDAPLPPAPPLPHLAMASMSVPSVPPPPSLLLGSASEQSTLQVDVAHRRMFDGRSIIVSTPSREEEGSSFGTHLVSFTDLLRGPDGPSDVAQCVVATSMVYNVKYFADELASAGAHDADVFVAYHSAGDAPTNIEERVAELGMRGRWRVLQHEAGRSINPTGGAILHAKVTIIKFRDTLRVIVSSANLIGDYYNIMQSSWVQDFKRYAPGAPIPRKPPQFARDLEEFLGVAMTGNHRGDPVAEALMKLEMARHDLTTDAKLVLTTSRRGGGHMLVRRLLARSRWPNGSHDMPVMVQTGSVGECKPEWLAEIAKSFGSSPSALPLIHFPTDKTATRYGVSEPHTQSFPKDRTNEMFGRGLKPIFRDGLERHWPHETPEHRASDRRHSHSKIWLRVMQPTARRELAGVLLIGSHNCSQNSMGDEHGAGGMIEASVLLTTCDVEEARRWQSQTPYEMPGAPYGPTDEPYHLGVVKYITGVEKEKRGGLIENAVKTFKRKRDALHAKDQLRLAYSGGAGPSSALPWHGNFAGTHDSDTE
ncbi:tyrosyl-DNA phosphodiesterase [Pseudoscourfieldia marina]